MPAALPAIAHILGRASTAVAAAWTTYVPAWKTHAAAWTTYGPAWMTYRPAWMTHAPAWTIQVPASRERATARMIVAAFALALLAALFPSAAHAQIITLRDGLGDPPAAGTSAGSTGWRANDTQPSAIFPAAILPIAAPLRLERLTMAIGRMTILGNLGAQSYRLRVWPSIDAAVQSPFVGTLVDRVLTPAWVAGFGALANGRPRYLVEFDLAPLQIDLAGGQSVAFNLAVVTPDSPSGLYGFVEAVGDTVAGPPDLDVAPAIPPPGYRSLCPGVVCVHTGKAAFTLTARPLTPPCPDPACPADINCSGALELQDIFDFLNAWFATSPIADVDGLNGVDIQDIFAFLNAWFAGC